MEYKESTPLSVFVWIGTPITGSGKIAAQNAGILAAKMLAVSDDEMLKKIEDYAASLKDSVMVKKEKIESVGYKQYLEEM